MIEIKYQNNRIFIHNSWYNIESVLIINDTMVDVYSATDEGHRFDTTFVEGTITINGVFQTSAQMIYDTLSGNA